METLTIDAVQPASEILSLNPGMVRLRINTLRSLIERGQPDWSKMAVRIIVQSSDGTMDTNCLFGRIDQVTFAGQTLTISGANIRGQPLKVEVTDIDEFKFFVVGK